jgi:hypothetical protein
MLLFGCLLALAASVAPRIILVLAWIFGRRWDVVWQGSWLAPLLGIIFLPYTTIMYLLVWSPAGLSGFDWVWLGLGVMLDIMKWSQIVRNRQGIPGQESSAQPATQTATASAAVVETSTTSAPAEQAAPTSQPAEEEVEEESAQNELDKLAELRDQGIITEEEYQAKKDQLEG